MILRGPFQPLTNYESTTSVKVGWQPKRQDLPDSTGAGNSSQQKPKPPGCREGAWREDKGREHNRLQEPG